VSSWVHQLLRTHDDFDFSLVCILPPGAKPKPVYELPTNVVQVRNIALQHLPRGRRRIADQAALFTGLEPLLGSLHDQFDPGALRSLIELLGRGEGTIGSAVLLDSEEAWQLTARLYQRLFPGGSFLDFFWSFRTILASMYSLLLAGIPEADIYHCLSTGYAGFLGAVAKAITGKPVVLTEHGLYTNERRLELMSSDWFREVDRTNLSLVSSRLELRDYWIGVFQSYSRLCYQACDPVVTLFEENRTVQAAEGAVQRTLRVIPNGIDFERFSAIPRSPHRDGRLTIALIGRVVPIKDVKTFIRACATLVKEFPSLRVIVLGPTDENEAYFKECVALASSVGLERVIAFLGQVSIDQYLPEIDLVVLSSTSESQPLVLLEAGAAGIPVVATDVGSCREIVFGRPDEQPSLGQGGAISRVADAKGLAEAIGSLLRNQTLMHRCGATLKERVRRYYTKQQQRDAYDALYHELLDPVRPSVGHRVPLREELWRA
jgi:glycosyltransferase involved in cell wall biosynthesis